MPDAHLKAQLKKAQKKLKAYQARITELEALHLHQLSPLSAQRQNYSIFDNLPESCQIVSVDWRYLYLNSTAIRHSQRTRSDLLGHTMMECYPGIEKTDLFATLQRCMRDRFQGHIEDQFIYPDGTTGWFAVTVEPIPEGILILSLDITPRKNAEEAVTRYTRRMEILHEIDSGIINASSIQAVVETSLKHIRQIIPCQRASVGIIDDTTREWVSFAVNSDHSTAVSTRTRIPFDPEWLKPFEVESVRVVNDMRMEPNLNPRQQIMLEEGVLSAIHILLTAQGQKIGTLNLSANTPGFFTPLYQEMAVEIANQLAIAIYQLHLVEALKRHTQILEDTRSFLQTTLDAFPANTTVLEPDGTIVTFNLLWQRFADENDAHTPSYYLGTNYLSTCDLSEGPASEEASSAAAGIRAVIAGHQDEFNLEYPCNSPSEERWFMLRVTPFMEAVPRRVVVAHINITERKQTEKSLNRSLQHLEILHRIDTGLIEARSIKSIVDSALQHIKQLIPCYRAGVFMFDLVKNDMVVFAADVGGPSAIVVGTHSQIPDAAWLADFGPDHAKIIPSLADASDLPLIYKQLVKEDMQSSLHVLLTAEGQTIGLLNLLSHIPYFFTDEHRQMVVPIGNQLAIAIHQMHLKEQMEEHVQHLRQAEEKLGLSEARYRSIVEDQAELICRYDANFRLTFVNSAYANTYGLSSQNMLGTTFLDNIPPEDRDLAIMNIKALTASHPLSISEHQSLMPDGSIRWFQWADRALLDQAGNITEYQGVGRDITAQKQAQSELEALYDATSSLFSADNLIDLGQQIVQTVVHVFEHVDCGLILIDREERRINRLIRMGSYSVQPDVILDLDGSGLVPLAIRTGEIVYAADVAEASNYISSEINTKSELVVPLKTAKGVIGVLDLQHVVRDAFGERDKRILAAYAERAAAAIENMQLYEEINQRAAELEQRVAQRTRDLNVAKERVETILHNSLDAIVLLGFDFSIQQVNMAFNRLFACEPDDYFNRILLDLIDSVDLDRVSAAIQTSISEGQGTHIEARARRKDDSVFDIELSIGYFRGTKDQGTEGFVCTLRDITHRKEQDRQLRYHASLQQNVSDAVIGTDMEFRIKSWNHAAEMIYGWNATEAIGKSVDDLLQTSYQSEVDQARILQDFLGRGVWQGEVMQRHRNGNLLHIQASVNIFKDDIGQPFGVVSLNRDITEQKRVAEALQKSSAEIHDLYNNAPCGYHSIDKNGLVVQMNDTELQWLGYTRDEIIGRVQVTALFTPASVLVFQKTFAVFVEQGWLNDVEIDMVRKDGSIMHILLNATAIYDDDGQYLKSRSTLFDITELQQAQQAIIDSEARYRLLAENISDVIGRTNADGIRTFITSSCYGLLGYTPDELIGQPTVDLVYPDDRAEAVATVMKAVSDGKLTFSSTQRLRHKDGHDVWVEVTSNLIYDPDTGRLVEIIGVIRDITERKQQERQLRYHASLQESVSDAVMVTDTEFRIQSWNRAAERIYGWAVEEVIGQSVANILKTEFLSTGDRERSMQQLREQGWWQGEVSQHHKDGSLRHILGSVTLIKDESGVPFSVVSVNHDITERKRAEEALRQSEERFALIFRTSPVAIGLTTVADGRYLDVNDGLLKLLGYSRDEIIGRTAGELNVWVTPEEREAAVRTIREDGSLRGIEVGFRTKTGDICTTLTSIVPVTLNNQSCLLSIVHDITDRKRAEDALSAKGEEEREFQRYLKELQEITLELTQIKQLDDFYKRAVELGLERFGFERLGLLLYDGDTQLALGTYGTDAQGNLKPEHDIRFDPSSSTGILTRTLKQEERFIFDANTELYDEAEFIGWGWNAASVLWNGTENLGWLIADNGVLHAPVSKPLLDILSLYALTLGALLVQKRGELALQESEMRFRLLIQAAPVAKVISNQSGLITLINPKTEALFGYSRDELIGQPIDVLVPEYARTRHESNRADYLAAPRMRQMGHGLELTARRKDGTEFPVEIELSYAETQDGLLVIAFVVDITERKRIAAELERQSSFLRSVIDVSPNMIFVKDYDSRFILANHGLAQLYNTTIENLIGKTDADFSVSEQELNSYHEADRLVITSGEPLFIEEPFTNYLGETGWFQTTKVPIVSADGKSKHVLGVSTDITERKHTEAALKESETKYRSLIETMRGGLAMFDLDNRITYINDRFCEILGYSREEVIGTRPSDYVDATHLPLLASQLQRRRDAESTTYELLFRHKNGNPVYLLVSGSPLLDKNGKVNGSFAVTTDITLQKQAEDTLRQALAKEKELGDLKSRFVSMASHEFRTPLATILALTETLSAYRHKLQEQQIDERFEKIKDQVNHLKDIMEDVLLLARMQARRVEFNPVIIDLDNLCRSVLDEFQSRPDVTHQIEYTCDTELQRVRLDKKLMRQVLNNLITNAIKYSPPNKTIRISLSYIDDALALSISDQGIGIPEADLPHLFEPFHRAANVEGVSGTGLGLIIIKEAVELHGGTIRVESQLHVGTTFTIHIPISGDERGPNDDKNSRH